MPCRTHLPWGYGHQFLAGVDADNVGGIMQRRQLVALLQGFYNLVIDDNGTGESFSPVYQTMSNRVDLIQALEHAGLLIGQRAITARTASVWVGIGMSVVSFSPPAADKPDVRRYQCARKDPLREPALSQNQ